LDQIVVLVCIKRINNAILLSKCVNAFEVAILRVLIKRQQPMKLSALVSGFPDDSEDSVFSAISSLKLHGYILLTDYQPDGYVSISRESRKEILRIIDPEICPQKLEVQDKKKDDEDETSTSNSISEKEKKSPSQVIEMYSFSRRMKAIATSTFLIVVIVVALESSMPTTSPDTQFVAYQPYILHDKWSHVYGANDHDGGRDRHPLYPPESTSFVALKNCDQKAPQQQQT
jgi:hypothetical protein